MQAYGGVPRNDSVNILNPTVKKHGPNGPHFLSWRTLVDDFRTNYAREIQKMQAANWNWCLPLAA